MRSSVVGLPTPHPLSTLLPAFMQEDFFTVRFTEGFDAVLAPVLSVLDCLDAYVDPLLAPVDFMNWLADWVGATLDDNHDEAHRRASVLNAVELHRVRGTVGGLKAHLEMVTGGQVQVTEGGGTQWSLSPTDGDSPAVERLLITVTVDDPQNIRTRVLEELIDVVKPAHLPHTIEVVAP